MVKYILSCLIAALVCIMFKRIAKFLFTRRLKRSSGWCRVSNWIIVKHISRSLWFAALIYHFLCDNSLQCIKHFAPFGSKPEVAYGMGCRFNGAHAMHLHLNESNFHISSFVSCGFMQMRKYMIGIVLMWAGNVGWVIWKPMHAIPTVKFDAIIKVSCTRPKSPIFAHNFTNVTFLSGLNCPGVQFACEGFVCNRPSPELYRLS